MTNLRKVSLFIPIFMMTTVAFFNFSGCGFVEKLQQEKKFLASINYRKLDLSDVKDGDYVGEFKLPLKSARVKVTVASARITEIELLEHSHGPGFSGEGVIPRVLQQQSLEVDAVSGATKSSTVVLKAIENAIIPGKTKI